MNNNETQVKRLEQLALTALYEDIVSQLVPTMDSPLVAVNEKSSSSFCVVKDATEILYRSANEEDYAQNKIKQSKVIDAIRAKLCHPPFRRVRASLMEEYCKHQKTSSSENMKVGAPKCPDVHLFLDCILDDDVTSFELNASFFPSNKMNKLATPRLTGPMALLNTIAKRCPKLETLTILCYYPNLNWNNIKSLQFNQNCAVYLPIFSLKNLLNLELLAIELKDSKNDLFFLSLGESCTKLKYLKIGKNLLNLSGTEDVIALFLGKKAHILANNWLYCNRNDLHSIQVSDQHVAPFCRSLEHLEISVSYDDTHEKRISLVAFILRHLPRLQTWAVSGISRDLTCLRKTYIFDAIQLLYSRRDGLPNRRKFTVQELDSGQSMEWNINTPPPSKLELRHVKFEDLNLSGLNVTEAVASMCPLLTHFNATFDLSPMKVDLTRSHEIAAILATDPFPNVVEATFSHVPTDYLEAILTSPMGSRLLKLNIKDLGVTQRASGLTSRLTFSYLTSQWTASLLMKEVELDLVKLLSPCKQLEELIIEESPSLIEETTVAPSAFSKCTNLLPNLKSLKVTCCLGQWSRIFETEMPALTNLDLYCSHIGEKRASDYHWSDAANLWPNLRQLYLGYAKGLTGMTHVDVLWSFDKLEQVTIPRLPLFIPADQRILANFDLMAYLNEFRQRDSRKGLICLFK